MRQLILWGLIGLALALRVGWGMSRPTSDESLASLPDQVEYLTLGQNLVHGQGLSFVDPRFSARVYAFRMPGYPIFVAACRADLRFIRAAQAVLDTSTVIAVFLLAGLVMPPDCGRARLLAAALVAMNPLLIYFTGLILSETLFVAMITWAIVLLVAGFGSDRHRARAWVWIAGGILLALSVLVRPSAILLPVVLGIGALFVNHRNRAAYQRSTSADAIGHWPLPVGSTMLLLIGLALAPWALRNYKVLHHLVWTDTNTGFTLYDGYNADATGASDQKFTRYMPQLRAMDELGRSQYLTTQATEFIQKHPNQSARLALAKLARTWSPMPLSEQFHSPLYIAIALVYSIPLDLLVLFSLWLGNARRSVKIFLLLPAIYLALVHALTVGSLRYRLPAEPALAVLAACAVVSADCRMKSEE